MLVNYISKELYVQTCSRKYEWYVNFVYHRQVIEKCKEL